MNLKQDLTTVLSAFAGGRLPKEETVEMLLRDVPTRQQILAHPRLAAELARRAGKRSGLTCTDVEELLPTFIDAERSGQAAMTDDQPLRRHIRLCPECHEVYRAACDILAAQSAGTLPHWPQPEVPAAKTSSTIVIPRALIRSKLNSWQRHQSARSTTPTTAHQMVYAGALPGHTDLFARVSFAQNEGIWQLRVSLHGSGLFLGRHLTLRFGEETRTTYADPQGIALFTHLPASWFTSTDTPDLQLLV